MGEGERDWQEFHEMALVWEGNEHKWMPGGLPGRGSASLADTSTERQA